MSQATEAKKPATESKYIEAIGRRKEATARVRLYKITGKSSKHEYHINGRELREYLPAEEYHLSVEKVMGKVKTEESYFVSALIKGGGIRAQTDAIRLGIARALVKINEEEYRPKLKKAGMLARDARVKERRKFGHRKARKKAQWSKR